MHTDDCADEVTSYMQASLRLSVILAHDERIEFEYQ
jgi:hypothetical protein